MIALPGYVNSSNAALTAIGSTGVTGTYGFGDIQFGPNGTLYVTTIGPVSSLYTINPQTAAATLVSNSLVFINQQTEAVTTLTSLPFSMGDIGGMTMYKGTGYFATGGMDLTFATGTDSLYSFNPYSGAYSLVGSFPSGIAEPGISGLAGLNTSAAPEPGALSLLGLGLAGIAHLARRRCS